jgi:nucleotide-binding universal stress UspA family protein
VLSASAKEQRRSHEDDRRGVRRQRGRKASIERSAELAKAFGAKLIVTSVSPVIVGRGGPIDPVDSPAEHRQELAEAKTFLSAQGVSAEYDLAIANPADHIVALAERHLADLIVVGTNERNLLERLLGLSVSRGVERKAHRDVLVVH